MTHAEVRKMAETFMSLHGLKAKGWVFEFDQAKRRLGCCNYTKKKITISIHHLSSPSLSIQDTILHEIAHALVGRGHGHGPVWRTKAIEIGAKPKTCGPAMNVEYKYALVCPECDYLWPRHRRSKRRYVCNRPSCRNKPVLKWVERKITSFSAN